MPEIVLGFRQGGPNVRFLTSYNGQLPCICNNPLIEKGYNTLYNVLVSQQNKNLTF
jgi:hypothetical protein